MLDMTHLVDHSVGTAGPAPFTPPRGHQRPRTRHVESYRANIVVTRVFYVVIRRARYSAIVYTGNHTNLTEAVKVPDATPSTYHAMEVEIGRSVTVCG